MSYPIRCSNKCCELLSTTKVVTEPKYYLRDKSHRSKSGAIIVDNNNNILITQSYNRLWGIPKGSKEFHESLNVTCVRETKEETGIDISSYKLDSFYSFFMNKSFYKIFYVQLNIKGPSTKNPTDLTSESTGCGWIKLECLYNLYIQKVIKLNFITRILLEKISPFQWKINL